MQFASPADELSEIRAEIARLQTREAALCAAFCRDPEHGTQGRHSRVEVVQQRTLEFDPALMPENLRYNANFHREVIRTKVVSQPLPIAHAPRPGWPIRREAAAALH
ncbi:MAG: hypothetical protein FD162_1794 [Rhodobacteraceae bacterium]|uniref:hypothetical protein n=1 Tax=Cypionkella sp. TaxID=2811411 RepID=UPI00132B483D|nr:hypothetical protein [Cypionkella sp.]KAF0173235.1 MAG: hypothetical protein FD162_1794 [Paracoccaceae bacterium]MDO8326831.1 hypothetical protein [Cypionkella sp.]